MYFGLRIFLQNLQARSILRNVTWGSFEIVIGYNEVELLRTRTIYKCGSVILPVYACRCYEAAEQLPASS